MYADEKAEICGIRNNKRKVAINTEEARKS